MLCTNRLHEMTDDNRRPNGACRICANWARRRSRAASKGHPLCWTATHFQPEDGYVCPCGDVPPEDSHLDWVAVERVLQGRDPGRALTAAEIVSALRTVVLRYGGGVFDAATWLDENTELHLDDDQVRKLIYRWVPESGIVPMSVSEALYAEMQTATDSVLEPMAA